MKPKKMKAKKFVASSEQESKDTIQKLKKRVSRLEREKKQLKSEISTLKKALNKGLKTIRIHTDEYDVEESIESAKDNTRITEEDRKEKVLAEMRNRFSKENK